MSSYLAILSIILITTPIQLNAQNDPKTTFCKKSIHEDVCQAAVETSPSKDKKGICNHALNLALSTISEMGKIFEVTRAPQFKKPIEECTDTYADVTELIKKAEKALSEDNFNSVNQAVSSAMSIASSCEYKFKEAKVASPVTELNKKFNKYLGVVITVSNLP